MRAGDPDAIRKVRASRDAAHLDGVLARLDAWLPTVRRMCPDQPWGDVVRVLNRGQDTSSAKPEVCAWTVKRRQRTAKRLATEGILEAALLGRSRRQSPDLCNDAASAAIMTMPSPRPSTVSAKPK